MIQDTARLDMASDMEKTSVTPAYLIPFTFVCFACVLHV